MQSGHHAVREQLCQADCTHSCVWTHIECATPPARSRGDGLLAAPCKSMELSAWGGREERRKEKEVCSKNGYTMLIFFSYQMRLQRPGF